MKNAWPLIIFAATLLPLGYGHTKEGGPVLEALGFILAWSVSFVVVIPLAVRLGKTSAVRVMDAMGRRLFRSPERRFLCAAWLWFFCLALGVGLWNNGCSLYAHDSIAQSIQAHIFAMGRLFFPAYPQDVWPFFDFGCMINREKFFSQYPPGHALMLLAGYWLGAPCLVNPLLGACSCIVIYYVAKALYHPHVARIAVLLCCSSPFLLNMSSEGMNHATALFFTMLFLLGLVKTVQHPSRRWWAGLSGFSIAWVLMTRPFSAVAIGLPGALFLLHRMRGSPRGYAVCLLVMEVAACVPLMILFWFNWRMTGDPFTFAYQLVHINTVGFGPIAKSMVNAAGITEHTPWHGIGMAFNNLNNMQRFLFGWPMASLVFVPLVFMWRRPAPVEWVLLATACSLVCFYVLYYFPAASFFYGPRFLYEISGILIIFSAFGVYRVAGICRHICQIRLSRRDIVRIVGTVMAWCMLFSLAGYMHSVYATGRMGVPPIDRGAIERRLSAPAILFMPMGVGYLKMAGLYYPITPDSRIIPAQDMGERNRELMDRYPGHKAYRVKGLGTKDETWQEITR